MMASRPKIIFWPGSSISPRNYGCHFSDILIKGIKV
jgi:hypothetical protein